MPMYKKYLAHTYKLGHNIVCACCGCISHDMAEFELVLPSYAPLQLLRLPETVPVPFDFTCGIDLLDQNRVLVDKIGITPDKRFSYVVRATMSFQKTGNLSKPSPISVGSARFQNKCKASRGSKNC
jgi:hypothetical protein